MSRTIPRESTAPNVSLSRLINNHLITGKFRNYRTYVPNHRTQNSNGHIAKARGEQRKKGTNNSEQNTAKIPMYQRTKGNQIQKRGRRILSTHPNLHLTPNVTVQPLDHLRNNSRDEHDWLVLYINETLNNPNHVPDLSGLIRILNNRETIEEQMELARTPQAQVNPYDPALDTSVESLEPTLILALTDEEMNVYKNEIAHSPLCDFSDM